MSVLRSLLLGAARVLDIGGSLSIAPRRYGPLRYDPLADGFEADAQALASDWAAVESDLRAAEARLRDSARTN